MDAVLQLIQSVADRIIAPRFRALSDSDVAEKTPGNLVTVADREAEQALSEGLLRLDPDALIVGEEACFADPSLTAGLVDADHAFTIDPIDGTGNFVRGSDDHAVMIAELVAGEVVKSWIWQPQYHRAYVAERGGGVRCNGELIHRQAPDRLPTGRASRLKRFKPLIEPQLAQVSQSMFSVGIDYPHLATGEVDFLIYTWANPWDHLPGALMVAETGGVIIEAPDIPYRVDGLEEKLLIAAASEALALKLGSLLA